MLLVAVEDLDKRFTKLLGDNFGFRNLQWAPNLAPPGYDDELVKSLNGASVGLLAWRKDRPGLEFIRRVAPGLGISLILIATLTYLLILWGSRQAKRLVESEEHATVAARTDPLTQLPNRVALHETLGETLLDLKINGSTLGVFLVDIDDLKEINDAFGHSVGDAVLVRTADRLRARSASGTVVARPDGDSFAILVPGIDGESSDRLAAEIVSALAEPVELDGGKRVFVTASVGYAIAPRDGDTADELLRRVDLALEHGQGSAASIGARLRSPHGPGGQLPPDARECAARRRGRRQRSTSPISR